MDQQELIALEKCLTIAKSAGVPADQAKRLIESAYIPLPWQWAFHAAAREADKPDGPVDVGLGGARGPGKSHAVLSQVALDDCQRIDNLKCLFLRQTGLAAKESFDDLVDKVVRGHTPYKKVSSTLKFPNNSRIILGGFKDENDIDKYIGIEYDVIIVEELNQLTEDKYTKLRGSLRTSKDNWRPRMYTSFNPGGIGHQFVKERYVIPEREEKQKETRFIGSTYKSNPYLNKEYIEYLESVKGDLGRMWREGEWEIFVGQAFPEFRLAKHVMKSIIPSTSFDHYLSIDWGTSPAREYSFSAYLHAVIKMKTDAGVNFQRVITYWEWCGNTKTPYQWAEIMFNDCKKIGVKPIKGIADRSMFNPTSDYSTAISTLFMNKWKELNENNSWVLLERGTGNRMGRKAHAHNWLSSPESVDKDGNKIYELPYWIMTDNCKWLAITIPQLIIDKNNPEDIDTSIADDPYDSATYFLATLKFVSVKGTINYKTGPVRKRVEFTKDGDQIPLKPSDFAEQYK